MKRFASSFGPWLGSIAWAGLCAGLMLSTSGCETDAFCYNCGDGNSNGANAGGAAGAAGSGGGQGGSGGSVAGGSGGSLTSDCSGADLNTDPNNCGTCGNKCERPGALAKCSAGFCVYECAVGQVDLNQDPEDGCEYACQVTNNGIELCDGIDNDCDGQVDEDFDLNTNALHCGMCDNPCIISNAVPVCNIGKCEIGMCTPGFYDNPNTPEPDCSYSCATSNGGVEICDGLDNDCDGAVDEEADTSSDPFNCGMCGKTCVGTFANAEPKCDMGMCVLGDCLPGYIDQDGMAANGCEYNCESLCSFPFAAAQCDMQGNCSMGNCLVGHYDINMDPMDGCEYACNPSNNGVEACDGKDNDCDAQVDEDFDLQADPLNCGVCGNNCSAYFPGATVACQDVMGSATCVPTGCQPGYANLDGNLQNGCEYQCTQTNGGVETCDKVDNDCDGIVDNPPGGVFNPPLPDQCPPDNPNDPCQSQTVCQNGAPACVQTVGPQAEICDGVDNDCNGMVDDGTLPQVGAACGQTQVGACQFGTTICDGANGIVCQGNVDPQPAETCNGLDDDCNGVADDNPTGQGNACTLGGGVGACANGGTQQCNGMAGFVCVGATAPATEVCDGPPSTTDTQYDNDCDGSVNEGCTYLSGNPVRLDTNGSNQTQHVSFQLVSASVGDTFFVAYSDRRAGSGNIYGRVTTNAGTSWGANDFAIANTNATEVEPSAFLRAGRAYVAYSRFHGGIRRIYVRGANSPYTSWSGAQKVDSRGTGDSSIDCYTPVGVVARTASSGSNDILAVVWSEISGTAANPLRNIFLSYSTNGGTSWATPVPVNTGAGANKGELPVVASDGQGMVYVAWRDKRVAGLAQMYANRIDLTQGSPAFGTEVRLQPNVTGASAEEAVIAAEGNNVYVAWTDLRGAGKTVRVARSNNKGSTWAQVGGQVDGVVINPGASNSDGVAPHLAVRAGRVAAVWEDSRSGKADIRFNRSDNAGGTWLATPVRVDTGDGLGATTSLEPKVAWGVNNTVYVAWQDLRFPNSSVLTNISIDSGNTFYPDAGAAFRVDTDTQNPGADSQKPIMLASPSTNRASVVWIDFRTTGGGNSSNGDIWSRLLQ